MTPKARFNGRRLRWYALALLVMAQFVVILDAAIVNVALPSIKTHLHFSETNLQWVITAYSITFGGLLLLGGRLADRLGRRVLFMIGVAVFSAASLLNGIATTSTELIGFRALQGVGAALLTPAALSILVSTFTDEKERNMALGIWGTAAGAGGAVGQLLGGALTSGLSWRWIFFINVPIGIAVVALSPLFLSESRAEQSQRTFDIAGATSITGAIGLLVYGLTRASQHGWGNGTAVALLAAAGVLIASFIVIEWRAKEPLLPLRLFRMRNLSGSNLAIVLIAGVGFTMFLLGTLYMQQVLHYSAMQTGLAFVAVALSLIVAAGGAQVMVGRIGIRPTLFGGFVLQTAGLVLLARAPVHGRYFVDLFPAFIVSGIGEAMIFVAAQIGAQAGVEARDSGVTSGLINTSQQIGGAIGVAVATTIATTYTSHYVASHPGTTPFSAGALNHGFQIAFWVFAGVSAVAGVLSALLVERKARDASAVPAGELALEAS